MLLERVFEKTEKYLNEIPKSERKRIGQFFTSKETARFMASLFTIPAESHINVLDPGAGSGILSAALIDRLLSYSHITSISLTCYENDEKVRVLLSANLAAMKESCGDRFKYRIITDNYITSQQDDFNGPFLQVGPPQKYDLVIANPPYKKIAKDAAEALAMPEVCHGAPNLYFLFAAMSLFNLREEGEMVYIIPRSWASGAYFRAFRHYLLTEGKLLRLHLFVSRDRVFEIESVLQETVILHVKKQKEPVENIDISSSHGNTDFDQSEFLHARYDEIVTKPDNYVFLVTGKQELATLSMLRQFEDTLPSLGMRMKTGLTVDFRNRSLLRNEPDENTVPMFYAQHIKNGHVMFPISREAEFIIDEQPGLVQQNKNYLFVKRFTSKEENRRLQCGIYLARNYPEYRRISTQNKINFVDAIGDEGLSEDMVYGLYTLLNSTYYDSYYRMLNGSTQVNSSEVNAMPMPPQKDVLALGRKLRKANELSVSICDGFVSEVMS